MLGYVCGIGGSRQATSKSAEFRAMRAQSAPMFAQRLNESDACIKGEIPASVKNACLQRSMHDSIVAGVGVNAFLCVGARDDALGKVHVMTHLIAVEDSSQVQRFDLEPGAQDHNVLSDVQNCKFKKEAHVEAIETHFAKICNAAGQADNEALSVVVIQTIDDIKAKQPSMPDNTEQ